MTLFLISIFGAIGALCDTWRSLPYGATTPLTGLGPPWPQTLWDAASRDLLPITSSVLPTRMCVTS